MIITIDNKTIECEEGETIHQVARRVGIDIPALCYHSDLPIKANCRLCVVEIEGMDRLQTSCSTKVKEGMVVKTETDEILQTRKVNLELLFAAHVEKCPTCVYDNRCKIQDLAEKYNIKIDDRMKDRKHGRETYVFGKAVKIDLSKCVDCQNCVDACQLQQARFLETRGKGYKTQILPADDGTKDCIYCGQCVAHCPVGAASEYNNINEVEEAIRKLDKIVVAQIAPSIRSSIGEEFDYAGGMVSVQQLAEAMRIIGFDKVFDTCVGADITTIEEAKELVERLETGNNLPMMTSCCPGWVKYVEFYHPEFIPNLTTVRSPQTILGGIVKTYYARLQGINPEDIVVVSVMPCTAKKFEIARDELKLENGIAPVDYVLTTREMAVLLKKYKVNPFNVKGCPLDNPLGDPTGAGIIYGASGGVMESAIRTAYFMVMGEEFQGINYEKVRGIKGIKRGTLKLGGRDLRVVATSGMENAVKILEEARQNPYVYDYIEIMACPGGCIGGGGQPIPVDDTIRLRRAKALYALDQNSPIRVAHKNQSVIKFYEDFLDEEDGREELLYTHFRNRKIGRR